jgi:hypothetical protein
MSNRRAAAAGGNTSPRIVSTAKHEALGSHRREYKTIAWSEVKRS